MSLKLKIIPSLLLVVIGSLSLKPAIAQTNTEESGSRKFLERLLDINDTETKIIYGKIPETIPAKVPIPPDSQILGSTINKQGATQIVLDASQSIEQVNDFYKAKLPTSGWKQLKYPYTNSVGFISKSQFGQNNMFCHQSGNLASMRLNIKKGKDTPTTVKIFLHSIDREKVKHHPCQMSSTVNNNAEFDALIPELQPPSKTTVSDNNHLNMHTIRYARGIIDTKLDSKALVNHYTQQLEKAGWKKIDSQEHNSYTWTRWRFNDKKGKTWQGIMSFTRIEGKSNHYFADIKALELGSKE